METQLSFLSAFDLRADWGFRGAARCEGGCWLTTTSTSVAPTLHVDHVPFVILVYRQYCVTELPRVLYFLLKDARWTSKPPVVWIVWKLLLRLASNARFWRKRNQTSHWLLRNMPIRRFGGHRSLVSHAPKLSYGYTKMNVSKSGCRVFSANSTTAGAELAKKITE